jgi:hypothetical protein
MGGKKQRSAHPILWIYLDFSTAQTASVSKNQLKTVLWAVWRRDAVQHA